MCGCNMYESKRNKMFSFLVNLLLHDFAWERVIYARRHLHEGSYMHEDTFARWVIFARE